MMVVTFTKHNKSISSSSRGMFEYLNKENEERIDEFWENALNNDEDIESIDEEKILIEKNLFFAHNHEDNSEQFLNEKEASVKIDENISSSTKADQSQFFMLNISPSKSEIEHLKEIADLELARQGISKEEIKMLMQSDEGKKHIEELRNDLVHQQLREYTKDVMKDYAENFDREVYNNPEKLPTQKEERHIVKRAKEILENEGVGKSDTKYAELLKAKKIELAAEIGKDLSTRKMNETDLVWFAKVEEKRTYKATDKWVMQNKKIFKEISALEKQGDLQAASRLREQLNRDNTTGAVVKEGMLKGGDNYHVHVVVSRYDKCPVKSKKVSISPLANHKKGQIGKGNNVGFNRDAFRTKVENSFDRKFKFERLNTYENYKNRRLNMRSMRVINTRVNRRVSNVVRRTVQPIRNELLNQSGYNEIRNLNPKNTISRELGFRIPLSVPKTPLEGAIKVVRLAVGKILDSSRGY